MATTVAFTACPSEDMSYSPGSIIQFGLALTNLGDFYNVDTSIFTCPVNGLYMFSISIFTNDNDYIDANIYKDGSELVQIYSASAGAIHGVNSVLTECNVFQPVWVECAEIGGTVPGNTRSSFSRVLLVENS